MQFDTMITALQSADPQAAAEFYVQHLDMEVQLDIGWFVNLGHQDHPQLQIALTKHDHPSIPSSHRMISTGVSVAVNVRNAQAAFDGMRKAGAPVIGELADHPWGQRQFFVSAPDGVLLDVIETTTPDAAWLQENGLS